MNRSHKMISNFSCSPNFYFISRDKLLFLFQGWMSSFETQFSISTGTSE